MITNTVYVKLCSLKLKKKKKNEKVQDVSKIQFKVFLISTSFICRQGIPTFSTSFLLSHVHLLFLFLPKNSQFQTKKVSY